MKRVKGQHWQKYLLVLSAVNVAVIGLVSIPFIVRGFPPEQLAAVTIILVINSLFGILDILRPVIISYFSQNKKKISWDDIAFPATVVSLVAATFISLIGWLFFLEYFSILQFIVIAMSFSLFVFYTALWGVLDLNGLMGLSALIKSFGVGFLYISFAVIATFDLEVNIVFPLLASHVISFLGFYYQAKDKIGNKKSSAGTKFFTHCYQTLLQNGSKILIDFTDRMLIAKFSPADFVSLYNVSYDLAARSNVPSQLIASYSYPALCKDDNLLQKFLLKGLQLSSLILIVAILMFYFGEPILIMYAGGLFESNAWVISLLLIITSSYTLAFFSQAGLRSIGRYEQLSQTFLCSAVLGLLLIYPLYLAWDIAGLLLGAFVLKTPGYWGYLTLGSYLGGYRIWLWLLVVSQIMFFFLILKGMGFEIFSCC